ncbi:MAG: universal stress protein [Ardenticatenia bacterium]|nr:universal stress protein [Ardenticatenia bacterium]
MRSSEPPASIRHILVALDLSAHSRAALDAAVELAAALRADVRGLFVEESEVLALGDLPAFEVGLYSAALRPLSREYLEQQLRVLARRAEAMLAEVAGSRQVRWSFHTVRGRVATALMAAAPTHDIVCLGVSGRSSAIRARGVGSTVRAALQELSRPLLVVRHGIRLGPPVVVWSPSRVTSALHMAARLRAAMGGHLVVLAAEPPARVERWLVAQEVPAHVIAVPGGSAEAVARAVGEVGAGLLVIPADHAPLDPEQWVWQVKVPLLWMPG